MNLPRRPESSWFAPPMLFSYVMAGMAGFISYSAYKNDTANAVERLQDYVVSHESKQKDRRIFREDMGYRVDLLCRSNPECDKRFSNLRVPE